jgi:mxaA protein
MTPAPKKVPSTHFANLAAARQSWLFLAGTALAVLFATGHAAPMPAPVVEQPRAFGYFLGDRLQQRVLLAPPGGAFQATALPQPERLGVWIERLSSRKETDLEGRAWLVVDYQIVNAAPGLSAVQIPAWTIKGSTAQGASGDSVLSVPPWAIQVAALTPPGAPSLQTLRPDQPAPLIPTGSLVQRMQLSLAALSVSLVGWLAWQLWRNRRAAARQPFALAWRQLRGLPDDDRAAWQALHRAFDRSAGRVVHSASLDKLFQAAPHFRALRPEIEAFYAQSEAFFFSGGTAAEPIALRELCKRLRRLEKGQER